MQCKCHFNSLALLFLMQDVDEIQVCYPSMFELMEDLKG